MNNPSKGFVIPLLLAIIAVLTAGGGTYVYLEKKQVAHPTTETTRTEEAAEPAPASTSEGVTTSVTMKESVAVPSPPITKPTTPKPVAAKVIDCGTTNAQIDSPYAKGTDTATQQAAECFEMHFKDCTPAKISAMIIGGSKGTSFEILGSSNDLCKVKATIIKDWTPAWVGQHTTCTYKHMDGFSNKTYQDFFIGTTPVGDCAGDLQYLPYIMRQEESSVTVISSVESNLKASVRNVGSFSASYFESYGNYGASTSETVCNDTIVSKILTQIGVSSTAPPVCKLGSSFPAKTFTVTVPSFTEPNSLYCVDQNGLNQYGFADLIPKESSQFVAGVKCK